MKLEAGNARAILWSTMAEVPLGGGAEQGRLREVDSGAARLRIVEYAPGFRGDHWCAKGHALYVIAGQLHIELDDGRRHTLDAGDSWVVGDGKEQHLTWSEVGARVFIVD